MSVIHDPRAVANLLLIEIGNSHVTQATSLGGHPVGDLHRVESGDLGSLPGVLQEAWSHLPERRLRAVVIASVVPEMTGRIRSTLESELEADPLVLGDDLPVSIENKVTSPESVGIDRLCGAAAAFDEIQTACAVASFGTATTIDCVDNEGNFRGGAILPGLALQSWSLAQRTAQLPEIAIHSPQQVYGGDTEQAILIGIVHGAVGALREIVEHYATDLGRWPQLILTGGFAPLIRESCEFVDAVVPDLVLRGMALSYRKFYSETVVE